MDFDYEDEGPAMEAEAKAFERVGASGKLAELLSTPIDDINKRSAISPEDRFLINTDAFCRRLNAENIYRLSETDINTILEKTTDVLGLKYKNFVAYVLGYIASKGGQKLKVDKVQNVITNILPKLGDEGGVYPADVVRYARYWNKFL